MMNFDQSPLLVIWETTQACDLTCVHCRASAQPERNPNELTTEEGFALLGFEAGEVLSRHAGLLRSGGSCPPASLCDGEIGPTSNPPSARA